MKRIPFDKVNGSASTERIQSKIIRNVMDSRGCVQQQQTGQPINDKHLM